MASQNATIMSAEAFATTDFHPDLASFTVPKLVIHGTADKTVPIDATGREIARLVPKAEIIEYVGEPHGIFATQTERLGDDRLAFLGKQRGSTAIPTEGGTVEMAWTAKRANLLAR